MEGESFREQNRRRREESAFENLYRYAKQSGIADPKRTAELAARRIHRDGSADAGKGPATMAPSPEKVPHRLEDRSKEQLYTRAQELGIDGRSQMTKAELIAALRNHG
jgi:hypothetical protein